MPLKLDGVLMKIKPFIILLLVSGISQANLETINKGLMVVEMETGY
jgi:hypothetical protein